nr:peptide deformylase [Fusobacterium nucleatum]
MVYEIKKYGEDVLKQIAKEVELNEINDEFRKFLDDMVETMYETDGVGLAAPQIGILKRILVIDTGEEGQKLEMINPKITKLEKEVILSEGCLSFPDIFRKCKKI